MREDIYQWMKSLAVFYLFFTAVLQLVPDRKYERYVRSFTGTSSDLHALHACVCCIWKKRAASGRLCRYLLSGTEKDGQDGSRRASDFLSETGIRK